MNKPYFTIGIYLIVITLSGLLFQNKASQGINWTFPYFSGAANYQKFPNWNISPQDFEIAAKLPFEEYKKYKHKKTDITVVNNVNTYGYVLVILVATQIFPFLGDIEATILFQFLSHLALSIFIILFIYKGKYEKFTFLILYAANPLIIHFVTFPFYYFWTFIPSLALIIFLSKPEWRILSAWLLMPLLLISLLIRPTTLFLCLFFYFLCIFYSRNSKKRFEAILATILFCVGILFMAPQNGASPWHTMYVGIGAYQNNFGVPDLGDNRGYEYFYSKSGISIDTTAIGGNWNDVKTRSLYGEMLKQRYFEILKEEPLLLLKNAGMNTLEVFSVGYIVNKPIVTNINALVGLFIAAIFLISSQRVLIISILLSSIGFIFYYPPIPAYNFAAYLLITFGIINSIKKYFEKNIMHVESKYS